MCVNYSYNSGNFYQDSYTNTNNKSVRFRGQSSDQLHSELEDVNNHNGIILDTWNDVKEVTGHGTSSKHCNETIERYENGEITYEEAMSEIDSYREHQEQSLDMFSNMGTSVVCATTPDPALRICGSAAMSAGVHYVDRATNNIEGDESDTEQIVRDAVSGGIAGAVSYVEPPGSGLGDAVGAGMVSGGISAAANTGASYLLDCAYDEREFDFNEFSQEIGTNTRAGIVTGGVGSALNYGMASGNDIADGITSEILASPSEEFVEKVNEKIPQQFLELSLKNNK